MIKLFPLLEVRVNNPTIFFKLKLTNELDEFGVSSVDITVRHWGIIEGGWIDEYLNIPTNNNNGEDKDFEKHLIQYNIPYNKLSNHYSTIFKVDKKLSITS